jgi:hypothetical protein
LITGASGWSDTADDEEMEKGKCDGNRQIIVHIDRSGRPLPPASALHEAGAGFSSGSKGGDLRLVVVAEMLRISLIGWWY